MPTNILSLYVRILMVQYTISLDDFKNLWQIFEKLFFSMNNYDVVLSLLDNVNAHNDGNLHIIKINYL